MIAWPNGVQVVAVSRTTSPVTHTAEVAVNKQSAKLTDPSGRLEKGSMSNNAPAKIKAKNPTVMI
jgi:hypothetical protein